jgi:transposase
MVVTAGIDVSKHALDIALWPLNTATLKVASTAAGYAELAAWLAEHGVERVGLEASGGYEIAVIDALEARGFTVIRFNAQRVRLFAKATGRLAKNDCADARTIARATAVLVDAAPAPRRRNLDPLIELLNYRRRLCDWIVDCANQREHLNDTALRASTARRQASLRRELARIDARLAALIAADDDWRVVAARLQSVPGVGPVLAHTLIALMPELGTLTRRAVACLAGLAPFDHDSAERRGERHIAGGRAAVREVLYMAALAARRCNPVIAAFAHRLAGKKPKVIITACMRKLLVILNALLRDGKDWRHAAA